jgi:hypothetical protein
VITFIQVSEEVWKFCIAHRIWQEYCDWVEFILIFSSHFQPRVLLTPKSADGTNYVDWFIPSCAGDSWQIKFGMIRLQVPLVVTMKMAVFWAIAPCRPVWIYQRFRDLYCFHQQSIDEALIALMVEAIQTSETLVNTYQSTWCYNPGDSHLWNLAWSQQVFWLICAFIWVNCDFIKVMVRWVWMLYWGSEKFIIKTVLWDM